MQIPHLSCESTATPVGLQDPSDSDPSHNHDDATASCLRVLGTGCQTHWARPATTWLPQDFQTRTRKGVVGGSFGVVSRPERIRQFGARLPATGHSTVTDPPPVWHKACQFTQVRS